MDWGPIVVALASGVGGSFVVGWLARSKTRAEARKIQAEASHRIGETYQQLLTTITSECDRLRKELQQSEERCAQRLTSLTTRVDELERENARLRVELAEAKGGP